jgi:hypothetical protein
LPLDPAQLGSLLVINTDTPGSSDVGVPSSTPSDIAEDSIAGEEANAEDAGEETPDADDSETTADGGNIEQRLLAQAENSLFAPGFSSSGTTASIGSFVLDVGVDNEQDLRQAVNDTGDKAPRLVVTTNVDSEQLTFERLRQLSAPLANVDGWLSGGDFLDGIDRLREDVMQESELEKMVVGSSFAVSGSLSVGYLLWAARSGVLLSSVLSSLPVWRFIDPFPVLSTDSLLAGDDGDDESLENIATSAETTDPEEEDA